MKKSLMWIFILIIGVIIAVGAFWYFYSSNKSNDPSTNAERISTNVELKDNQNTANNEYMEKQIISVTEGLEMEISSFSTKILVDDDNRDNNLEITASKINETVVKNGESFSFNDTVGNPTPDKGYEKAGVFIDGKKSKGYGGGNCQISSTLYDAVLKINGIKITERHEHSKDVGYVKKGQDATVVYDELDLKFENNTGYDIKIYAEVTDKEVKVKITRL